jgi:putative MFS transporter
MLGGVAMALLFESYDQSMLSAAAKQVAEGLGVLESDLAELFSFIRLGAIPAFLLVPLGDSIGRRRLFLISLIGISLATVASAFAQTTLQFVVLQMISRTFMVTCSATAYVIVSEEFPKEHRGWGVGILGALAAFGTGLGLLLFAVIDYLPFGWRAMYVVGVAPLLMLPWFRARVPETSRFHALRRERTARGDSTNPLLAWLRPVVDLARVHPGRMVAVGLIGAFSSMGHAVGFNFAAFYVQALHGWAPWQFTLMAVAAGLVGIVGHPLTGRIADERGRRIVGVLLFGAFPPLAYSFYHCPAWMLPVLWIPLVFTLTGGITISRALATELFPTSQRGTAGGWLQLTDTLGASAGFALVALGTAAGESNVPTISLVVFATLAAAVVVWFLPETGRRELEEISREP